MLLKNITFFFSRYNGSMMHVYLGGPNNTVARNVTSITFYDVTESGNDICLLKLESPVAFTDHIRPICLPTNNSSFYTGMPAWFTSQYWNGKVFFGPWLEQNIVNVFILTKNGTLWCLENGASVSDVINTVDLTSCPQQSIGTYTSL